MAGNLTGKTEAPFNMTNLKSKRSMTVSISRAPKNALEKGFTLVELMIVIVIVGILSAIALPNFLNNTTKAKATEAKTKMSAILKEAHAEYQLDGKVATAATAATLQAAQNNSDNFTYAAVANGANDVIDVTASANSEADGGDGSLASAAGGNPIRGCVELNTGKVEISSSFTSTAPTCL